MIIEFLNKNVRDAIDFSRYMQEEMRYLSGKFSYLKNKQIKEASLEIPKYVMNKLGTPFVQCLSSTRKAR